MSVAFMCNNNKNLSAKYKYRYDIGALYVVSVKYYCREKAERLGKI